MCLTEFEPGISCASWNFATSYTVDVQYSQDENIKFVCEYIAHFQSLNYFRTELLTRAKFSRHVLTGFCGPTGDGKSSHHKVCQYSDQRFKQISSVSCFADMASVV